MKIRVGLAYNDLASPVGIFSLSFATVIMAIFLLDISDSKK